ncbi:integrin alpha-PS2 [Nasonia vitripennis]|uniref:Integrin alpha-2 domain-containing protein n=1 Tax=Nasonia vitripennis TaxID=7425 RepID=A0A7M7LUC0_NASVI|nr:integrin alpha-PS2 [Nasonia vitripennis]XP_031785054.1 integrin alpha-PS2 [Nasonia vitripennis]
MWNHGVVVASLLFLALLLCNENHVLSFNVETVHYAKYENVVTKGSMFGYAVAGYRDSTGRGHVIVGAPMAPSTNAPPSRTNHSDIGKGGAVFYCDIAQDNACSYVVFDYNRGHNFIMSKQIHDTQQIDNKTLQWLGATLSASETDGGPLLACAPRYRWFGYNKANQSVGDHKDVLGSCWLAHKPTEEFNSASRTAQPNLEFSPCRNSEFSGHHRQGMCQAGIGAAITKDGNRLFIGAPGSWYWQGQLFTAPSNVKLPFVPSKEIINGKESSSSYERLGLLSTKEGPAWEDNNYLGYSVAVGAFRGDEDSGVAVGVPRGADLHGKVLLFTSTLFNHQNITGEQMGAYFGYALAVNDIDGDDKDDLIVTAPFFTQPELAGIKIETGRIYVFYQGGGTTPFQKFDFRNGDSNRGQFGLSVSSLGDIDRDGYGDFVVGEPYGGPANRGAVYIYHGSKDGVEEKYSQVIYSENMDPVMHTFGWSVSGGRDLDGNGYPDLIVGAYESDAAVFFRSRPVIEVFSEINFDTESVDLDAKICLFNESIATVCPLLKVCCFYSGNSVSRQYTFKISITLDDKKKMDPRILFHDSTSVKNITITLTKDEFWCNQYSVYVMKDLKDKLTPLDAEMHIELLNDERNTKVPPTRIANKGLRAVLGPKNIKKRDSLRIQKNCKDADVCIPDLTIHVVKSVERYLMGSTEELVLHVSIYNSAEDAFESRFYMPLPPGVEYSKLEFPAETSDKNVDCKQPDESNNNTLICDLGNPLSKGRIVKFSVRLRPTMFHGMKPQFELNMSVNSTNPEHSTTTNDNYFNVALPIWIENDLLIEGQSKPHEVDLNSADYANVDIEKLMTDPSSGPVVTHNYTIRNNGPSPVLKLNTTLVWVAETNAGEVLLHLIEQPVVSDKTKFICPTANANYELIYKEPRKTRNAGERELEYLNEALFDDRQPMNIRYRRQVSNELPSDSKKSLVGSGPVNENLCATALCVEWTCEVGPLERDEEVTLSAKFLINMKTLKKITTNEKLTISTKLIGNVTAQPYIGEPIKKVFSDYEIKTVIEPLKNLNTSDMIPLWIVVLSACAGMTILLLLAFLLYKCGFFKRNRPSAAPERQPLNR